MTQGTSKIAADTGEDPRVSKGHRAAKPANSKNTPLRQQPAQNPQASQGALVEQQAGRNLQTSQGCLSGKKINDTSDTWRLQNLNRHQTTQHPPTCRGGPGGQQRTAQSPQTSQDHTTALQQANQGPQAYQHVLIKQHAAGSLHTPRDLSCGQQHAGSDRQSSQRGPGKHPHRTSAGSSEAFRGRSFLPGVTPNLPAPDITQKRLRLITISESQINNWQTKFLKIKEAKYVASYNWVENGNSTILVPGKPPKWLPPTRKQQLREDSGHYYRDPNAARYPQYPTEPAVRSVYELNQDLDTSNVDIFGCGSTFGSLLSFARNEERTFRFGVERIGETIFLVRKTSTPQELIDDVRGYGHSFPEAYTVWEPGVKGSASHQRIIRYDFAGLQCMIRTECDGYLSDKSPATDMTSYKNRSSKDDAEVTAPGNVDSKGARSLANTLSALTMAYQPGSQPNKLILQKAGNPIRQHAIFDLKTRSIKRKDNINMSEFLPRLWANQTPNFILAWHRSGTFDEIEVKDVRDDISNWEMAHTKALAKFRSILKELIDFSKDKNRSRFEVRRTGTGDLEIWSEVKGWSALPSKLKARWRDGLAGHKGYDGRPQSSTSSVEEGDDDDDYLRF